MLRHKVAEQDKKLRHHFLLSLHYGLGANAVKAPARHFVLAKYGMECIAVQFVERDGVKYKYRWFLQSDGSMDFSKDNVQQGEVGLFEKDVDGKPGNVFIKQGTFNLVWSMSGNESGWIYYSQNGIRNVQLAIVGPVEPKEINGRQATWYSHPPKG